MKILRFIGISGLKWIASYFVLLLAAQYIIPWNGWGLAIPMLLLSSGVAFLFAWWALHRTSPTRRDVIELVVVWFVVSFGLQIFYNWIVWGEFLFYVRSLELWLQHLLELAMIILAAWHVQRVKVRASLPKGMEL